MKVLHINEHLARKGGVETYLLALMPMLEARGIAQQVIYDEGDPAEHAASFSVHGIKEARFGAQKAVYRQVLEILQRERPDVVHIHNFQNVGVLQASLDYGPTVMTTHDHRAVCPASTQFYKRTQEVCSRTCGPGCFAVTATRHCLTPRPRYATYFYHRSSWCIRHAHRFAHIIAPCRDAKERLGRAGFDSTSVTVLPYFCPLEPATEPRNVPETPTITYIGRIASNKGHEYFVEALGLLPETVQGVMVGSFTDESERAIQALAQQHGCQGRLTLRRWATREEVLQILDATSVFIFPSLWPETLGIVGIEALSRGVPVVASDLGGVREWLRDGENGRLVPPKSATLIKEAVLELTASTETLIESGKRGIATIREAFMPARHTERLVDIYEDAASLC